MTETKAETTQETVAPRLKTRYREEILPDRKSVV